MSARYPRSRFHTNENLMSHLFSPWQLDALRLPNRIVVAPMCQYAAVRAIYEYLEAKSAFINSRPGIANPFVLR